MTIESTSRDNRSFHQIIRKAVPLEKANLHNENKNADTNFLDTALSPSDPPCLFRIEVMLPTAGKFTAKITKSETEMTCHFNQGSSLSANALYMFDMLVHSGDTVNFQSDENQTGLFLRVQEILWGVQ